MRCYKCGSNTSVIETRDKDGEHVRRRQCSGPVKHRFNTYEVDADRLQHLNTMSFKYQRVRTLLREDAEFAAQLVQDYLNANDKKRA